MDVPYFIKEHLWMSASNAAKLKKLKTQNWKKKKKKKKTPQKPSTAAVDPRHLKVEVAG